MSPPSAPRRRPSGPLGQGAQQPQWTQHLLTLDNPHPSPLSGTLDLVSLFHLEPLYDTFLRPYLPAAVLPSAAPAPASAQDRDRDRDSTPTGTAAPPASPSPAPAAAGTGAGFKITLGGVKFGAMGGSAASAGGDSADGTPGGVGTGAGDKKRRRAKMEKTYEHLVGDVLGRISHPRSASTKPASSLLHLVSNPDPAPCPPLHTLDPPQLREAFTLRPGALAGFDMSLWEARSGVGGGAGGERKKKKKRKHDDHSGGAGGGPGSDAKKQRR